MRSACRSSRAGVLENGAGQAGSRAEAQHREAGGVEGFHAWCEPLEECTSTPTCECLEEELATDPDWYGIPLDCDDHHQIGVFVSWTSP